MNMRSGMDATPKIAATPSSAAAPRRGQPTDRDITDTADVFGLLADPGRLRLLIALRLGEQNVGQLADLSGLSESATSHALRLLRAHRVVEVRRDGRMAIYRLADVHVSELLEIALAHAEHTELIHPERGGGHGNG
ncbi:ArsR/SmtB family transcription factor [Jatrophihabitans sp. DSM 45814]